MIFFRKLLASSFCLLCLFCIGAATEASTIKIEELDRNWRPKADVDFPNEDVSASVIITLNGVDFPSDPNGQQPYVTVSLSEVTNWKGICGNDDDSRESSFPNDPPKPDLVLERTDSHNSSWYKNYDNDGNYDGTLSRTLTPNDAQISVKVSCKDYGAYGKITATLWDYAGAGKYKSTGSNTVPIPRDRNNNKIADIWESKADVNLTVAEKADVTLDVETGPGDDNANDGDGLSIFAEYRGFKLYDGLNSRWQYTSPRQKDIFVTWSSNISDHKAGYADEMPLKVNLVDQAYINNPNEPISEDTTKWVNYNNEDIPGPKRVYAVLVRADTHEEMTEVVNDQGETERKPVLGRASPSPSIPSHDSVVTIYTTNISNHHSTSSQSEIETAIKNVIAHEVAHCVRLNHCPTATCPDIADTYCYMDRYRDRTSTSTVFRSSHDRYYDAHTSDGISQPVHQSQVTPSGIDPAPTGGGRTTTTTSQTMSPVNIISTNTGSSTYGCDYNAEYDYCTDTGTCTTRTDATGVGMCGHRWCCCAPATTTQTPSTPPTTPSTPPSTPVTSTNTGPSIYGCDYNAEYDYCTDTGSCTTRTGSGEVGMCGHRWCCCAPQ